MDVTDGEAKNDLPPDHREVRLGTMKDRIKFLPGWDDPIDPDGFLEGDL
jgi:hypothetical protein